MKEGRVKRIERKKVELCANGVWSLYYFWVQ